MVLILPRICLFLPLSIPFLHVSESANYCNIVTLSSLHVNPTLMFDKTECYSDVSQGQSCFFFHDKPSFLGCMLKTVKKSRPNNLFFFTGRNDDTVKL